MATGGSFSRTLDDGNEPFYDFSCSLCDRDGKHMEAVKYCEECFVYMCDSCIRTHNRFPLNSRHKLLDQSQFTTLNQHALRSFPTRRCLKHPGELINIFCEDHDVVCCSVCKALDHSSCTKTKHLPDAVKAVTLSQEYQNTKEVLSEVNQVFTNRTASVSRLAKEKKHVKQTIANFRKRVHKYFDDLEQKSLNELDVREKSITSRIDQDIKYLNITKTKAEVILKQIETFKGDNESDQFVQFQTGKNFVHENMEKVQDMSRSEREESIKFVIDPEIEVYLSTIGKLGTFSKTRLESTSAETQATAPKQPNVTQTTFKARHTSASTDTQKVVPKQSPVSQTKQADTSQDIGHDQTQLFGRYNVHEQSDSGACHILDICQLPDGNILIIDETNQKLKRFDTSYKLIDFVKLSKYPRSVCAIGSDEVAVSMNLEKYIQIVSVGRSLSLTRILHTGDCHRGVAYNNGEIYVCCGDATYSTSWRIEVYNKVGQLEYRIPRKNWLSFLPNSIIISDDGQYLFVTTLESGYVIMLDIAGNVVTAFSDKTLKGPRGLCTDGRGHVFVCGIASNTIHRISLKSKTIEVILSEAYGIKKPVGVCYDREHYKLLVSCDDSNNLLVFNMK